VTVVVEGPAFTRGVKRLGGVLVVALLAAAAAALPKLVAQRTAWPTLLFLLLATACVVAAYVGMLRGRTRLDTTHLRETGLVDREVALTDIRQIKLVHVPGLAWLIAPRLVIRTLMPGSMVFHAGDEALLQAFVALSRSEWPPRE